MKKIILRLIIALVTFQVGYATATVVNLFNAVDTPPARQSCNKARLNAVPPPPPAPYSCPNATKRGFNR